MKTLFSILSILFFYCSVSAQQKNYEIDQLLKLKKGASKASVIDSLKQIKGVEILNVTKSNNQQEILICRIANTESFNGKSITANFYFSNGALSNAYLQTEFARADFYDLQNDIKQLRAYFNQQWEKEKERKRTSTDLLSTGFEYSKPKNNLVRPDKILLQYIHTKADKGYGVYLLQLSWVDSKEIDSILY